MIVIFEPEGKRVDARPNENLLEISQRAGMEIRSDCGGEGTCGKCRIIVDSQESLNGYTAKEIDRLTNQEMVSGQRLACQSVLDPKNDSITISIPLESKIRHRRFQIEGMEREIELRPAISKRFIRIVEPTLNRPVPDAEMLLEGLERTYNLKDLEIDFELLERISETLREAEWETTAIIWNDEKVISLERKDTTDRLFGFAVDIGTSKIVGQLVDLKSGETVFTNAVENPQLPFGEDVMSRITYSNRSGENLKKLSSLVRDAINKLVVEGCSGSEISVKPEEIYEFSIVGNSVMHHLFLSITPFYLSQSPYVPTIKAPLVIPANGAGLKGSRGAVTYLLPLIAGFVGADAIADVISTGIHEREETSLLIDIGTNTEVFVGNKDDLVCCSCASGPAFEGMHIKYGVKGVSGAIESVEISSDGREVDYATIDDEKPIGICGSGVIDIIAELFNKGLLNKRGYFKGPGKERFVVNEKGAEFVIVGKEKAGCFENITISEEDILSILLAKAAVRAGCNILMRKKGIAEADIDQLLIAGAFGNHLNIANAKTIGLIPDVPESKISVVGNASISGAKMCLMSTEMREQAVGISNRTRYIELAAEPEFRKEFAYSLYIPYK